MATHSSTLAYSIPWTEEPGGLQFIGSQRVRHNSSNLACTHNYINLIKPSCDRESQNELYWCGPKVHWVFCNIL